MKNIFKSKFFTKIGRRNLMVVAIVLLLGVAVYVNYQFFYDPTADMGYGDSNMQDQSANANPDSTQSDYFASADLSRQKARDEALEVLQATVEASASEADVQGALAQIARIAEDIENESNIKEIVEGIIQLCETLEKLHEMIREKSAS